ncbi:MAG TPA: thiolase family protein [Firmicutes bacterium]|jgi:acetyl-CoA C-acetyltransferase|nr:thiolase family protein [Bacillota bacterium]
MKKPVIVSAVRTIAGSFGGSLKSLSAGDLGAAVVAEVVKRAGITPEDVDQLIFGCGWQAGIGPNIARICAVRGGLPHSVPAYTVNVRCASSIQAMIDACRSIMCGDNDVVIAGGTESGSNVPFLIPQARWGARMWDFPAYDGLHMDGFKCALAGMFMGNTAELLAEKYDISRQEQDEFALWSHQKASKAVAEDKFRDEILSIEVKQRKKTVIVDQEEIPRPDASLEKMLRLPAVFQEGGTVTAGNSCALCDCASAVVIMSEEKAKSLGLTPMARILGYAEAGVDPKYMGIGPVAAVPKALKKAGLELKDIDLIELNEAFSAQYIACDRELHFDRDKVNVHGGAISLGHPVGATGTKLVTTNLNTLRQYDKTLGLVSMCVGGGQGLAVVLERLS